MEQIEEEELEIGLLDYKLSDRHDAGRIVALATSIRINGLFHPVMVHRTGDGRYWVDAGAGRIEAFKSLGKKRILANIYPSDPVYDKMRHIDENLARTEVTDFEWDEMIADRLQLIKKVDPDGKTWAKRGRPKRSKKWDSIIENNSAPRALISKPTVAELVAEQAGVSPRTVKAAASRAARAAPAVKESYKNEEVTVRQVDEIVKIEDPGTQESVLPLVAGKSLDETREVVANVLNPETRLDPELKSATTLAKALAARISNIKRLRAEGCVGTPAFQKPFDAALEALGEALLGISG